MTTYQDKFVVFLDMLGFKSMVEASRDDIDKVARLHELVELFRDTLTHNPSTGLLFTQFSDCIVVSADQSPPGLWELIRCVETLTINMLQYDVLMRGGMSVGPVFHERDVVFGPAMNEAYRLESCDAKMPLTLISSDALSEFTAYGPQFEQWLAYDGSLDRPFIDYLMLYRRYDPTNVVPGDIAMEYPASRLRYFMSERLRNKSNPGVYAKAVWLQTYWNERVVSEGYLPVWDDTPHEEGRSVGPTIIKRRLIQTPTE